MPRDRVYVVGVNQSWRETKDVDMHVAIDYQQFKMPEAKAYYDDMAKRGALFHTGGGEALGRKLDRHDALEFSLRPLQKRHRGHKTSAPPLALDGGVALKVGDNSGGSTAYVALQIVWGGKFERVWMVGLDMGVGALKFTGERSNAEMHDRLWSHVPKEIREKVFVIKPSATNVLQQVPWPWGIEC